jgi:hypothetical protein
MKANNDKAAGQRQADHQPAGAPAQPVALVEPA